MTATTILFSDIVSYSIKSTIIQRKLVESLTSEIKNELHSYLDQNLDVPKIVALPTGDGIAVAFIHDEEKNWIYDTLFNLILKMHNWAYQQSSQKNKVAVRIGIHVGTVELTTDINGRKNICGDTINFAQRIMDSANPRQTLFSESAFREYIGSENTRLMDKPFSNDLQCEFHGPIEMFAKHGRQIIAYKMMLKPKQKYYDNDDPVAKHLMVVSLTPLPKHILGQFSKQIANAYEIAFIQLTGDRFLQEYQKGKIKFSKKLRRLWVFMPAPEVYINFNLTKPQATAELVINSVKNWKELLKNLKSKNPTIDVKLGLFKEPPYFGASFLDWKGPGGKIHVSPYIWDVDAPNCPGYDIFWIGTKKSEIYEKYIMGLEYLNGHTDNELEK